MCYLKDKKKKKEFKWPKDEGNFTVQNVAVYAHRIFGRLIEGRLEDREYWRTLMKWVILTRYEYYCLL
jgi:hypothetical protein